MGLGPTLCTNRGGRMSGRLRRAGCPGWRGWMSGMAGSVLLLSGLGMFGFPGWRPDVRAGGPDVRAGGQNFWMFCNVAPDVRAFGRISRLGPDVRAGRRMSGSCRLGHWLLAAGDTSRGRMSGLGRLSGACSFHGNSPSCPYRLESSPSWPLSVAVPWLSSRHLITHRVSV